MNLNYLNLYNLAKLSDWLYYWLIHFDLVKKQTSKLELNTSLKYPFLHLKGFGEEK